MIRFLTLLLLCQLVGEVITVAFELPVPGPVVGMVILFCGFVIRGGIPVELGEVAAGILRHLSLLFVPAGVGVMLHAGKLEEEWLAVTTALVVSAVVTLIVTGWLMQSLGRRTEK